jgi:hypothetical protein
MSTLLALLLSVSPNGHYLQDQNGKPFFYLADTGWELFHRLNEADAEFYFKRRAEQGFTAIQCVILAEFSGLTEPNANGDLPLLDNDPARPNEPYFRHVDKLVERMNARGLVAALLPTWGDKWNQKWGAGPEVFTPENAAVYGEFLGKRYRNASVIWVMGGDRPVDTPRHRDIVDAMAKSIRKGSESRQLFTFHPCGKQKSSQYFHNADWLSFNMSQTGHGRNFPNYRYIWDDFALQPAKPCIDGEPGYEDHFSDFNIVNGFLRDIDVRHSAWWALLAGAAGHTYGCHAMWQFWEPGRKPVNNPMKAWRLSIDNPGAIQMGHLRRFIESLPNGFKRRPDPALVSDAPGEDWKKVVAASDRSGDGAKDARWIAAYFPFASSASIDTTAIASPKVRVKWFDPRTGETHDKGVFGNHEKRRFETPSELHPLDWVLVISAEP